METDSLKELYTKWSGQEPQSCEKLPGAGSNRVYYRITGNNNKSVIGVIGTSIEENKAFVYLANHFNKKGLPMPKVFDHSADMMCYIQEDLGGTALFDAIKEGREKGGQYNEREKELLSKTIRQLPAIQVKGAEGLDFSICYPQPEFDETNVMFDLNYFKYCYLKATGIDFHEIRLEEDFRRLAKDLTEEKGNYFMYRDFQARNVMLTSLGEKTGIGFIDFQGGRRGPFYYDVA